ncbi:MAG: GIY-YIG nuclease family protein [Flavobacteriaceae bacterium]
MQTWTVYILKCRDNTYYTGCTNNFDKRLLRHHNRHIHYTRNRLPVHLISKIVFWNKYKAYNFERYLKSGSGKAFMKRHLI